MDVKEMIYDCQLGEYIQIPEDLKAFFDEIDSVCKKYNLSISHEDGHGGFIIERYNKFCVEWLRAANKDY